MPTEGVIGTRMCMLACHFCVCLAGVTPNRRCIIVDITIIITIAIFNDIIKLSTVPQMALVNRPKVAKR